MWWIVLQGDADAILVCAEFPVRFMLQIKVTSTQIVLTSVEGSWIFFFFFFLALRVPFFRSREFLVPDQKSPMTLHQLLEIKKLQSPCKRSPVAFNSSYRDFHGTCSAKPFPAEHCTEIK